MKPACLLTILVLLSTPSFCIASEFSGRVVAILDGDTIEVLHTGKAERIRLAGIDCPEKKQPFGQRAKQAASGLSFGQQVTVHPIDKDRYGRTLATVVLANGKNLNHELVRGGWCWWFTRYAPDDYELEGLEQAARQARKGLWIDPRPIPPWEFRKAQRNASKPSPSASNSRISEKPLYAAIIGNRDSHLYHLPGCPSYGQIADENRVDFASESDARAAGYRLASNCP